jgi:hypothetical protein
MGEQNLHRFKAESAGGGIDAGKFLRRGGFFPELPVEQNAAILRFIWAAVTNLLVKSC